MDGVALKSPEAHSAALGRPEHSYSIDRMDLQRAPMATAAIARPSSISPPAERLGTAGGIGAQATKKCVDAWFKSAESPTTKPLGVKLLIASVVMA